MSDSVNKYFLLILLSTIFLYSCSSSSYNQRYNKPEKQKEEERDNSVRWTSADDSRESDNKKTEKENTYANPSNETELPEEEYYNDQFLDKFQKLKVLNNTLTDREKVLLEIASYIDTPYEYGGESRRGIDCSAFTQSVYETTLSVELPRSSDQQFLIGETVNNFNNLEFGDLIFFDTTDSKVTGHVGIYIGDGLFAHSSTSKGVNISSLNKDYYKSRFAGGKRVWQFK
jgi:cell wall-associated NlpC family hydrolase